MNKRDAYSTDDVNSIDRFRIMKKHNISFVRFEHIHETGRFVHGFSTRLGGVSLPPYDALNLGFTTDDDKTSLIENRKRFVHAVGIPDLDILQRINQVHGNLVLNYEEIVNCAGSCGFEHHPYPPQGGILSIPDADGLVSDKIGLLIALTFADCIPIFLADPVTGAFGIVHAGWRGTFSRIAFEGVKRLENDFNSSLKNILAGIGPGIGRCCFEVGAEVADAFFDKFANWKDLMKDLGTDTSNRAKWKIDLLALNKRILLAAGLQAENVKIADLCTFCRKDLFYSYRRDGKRTGRMAAVAARTK